MYRSTLGNISGIDPMYLRRDAGVYKVQVSLQRILHYHCVHNKVTLNTAHAVSPPSSQAPHPWIQAAQI